MSYTISQTNLEDVCHNEKLHSLKTRIAHLFKDEEKVLPLVVTDVLVFLINLERKWNEEKPELMEKNSMFFLVSKEQLMYHLFITERQAKYSLLVLKKKGLIEGKRKGVKGKETLYRIDYEKIAELLAFDDEGFSSYTKGFLDVASQNEERKKEAVSTYKSKWEEINLSAYKPIDEHRDVCNKYGLDEVDVLITQFITKALYVFCSTRIEWSEADLNTIRKMISGSKDLFSSRKEQSHYVGSDVCFPRLYDAVLKLKNEDNWQSSWALCLAYWYGKQNKNDYSLDNQKDSEIVVLFNKEGIMDRDYTTDEEFISVPMYRPTNKPSKKRWP